MRASIDELPVTFEHQDAEGRSFTRQLVTWGDQEASFIAIEKGCNMAPPFRGLHHDNCPARHWGYVIRGRMRVQYVDSEEICTAGDMFYWPPHHMPIFEEDTLIVEFSPVSDQEELIALLEARDNA